MTSDTEPPSGQNITLAGVNRCPSGVSGSSALVSTEQLCNDLGGVFVEGACTVDQCDKVEDCPSGQIHPQVQLQGACPPDSNGTFNEATNVCTVQNACLNITPVSINLAGANRCEMLGMKAAPRTVSTEMTEAECKTHGGTYAGGKCELQVCVADDPPPCTPDDTFRSTMTIDGGCDQYVPGATNPSDATRCDVKNVCIRKDPGNPIRLHLIRPGLDCVKEALKKGVETYEGEVLIASLTAKECEKRGGAYLAGQCQLSAVNKLTNGKCSDFNTPAGSFKSTEQVGPVAGLSQEACEAAGGTHQPNTGLCDNATYCAVADPSETACKPSWLLFIENTSGLPIWIVAVSLLGLLVVALLWGKYTQKKLLTERAMRAEERDISSRSALARLGSEAQAAAAGGY